jgi:FOG: LysM repeat
MQQYVVKPNDTLYLIAEEFNVPLAQLITANPHITNPNLIYEGQTIIIPDMPSVPEQIATLESNALSIINDIFMADWQSAGNKVNLIRTAMNNMVPALQAAKVPNNIIFGLNAAIRTLEQNILQRRSYPSISQANRITQLIADVLDYFNVVIPPDVMRLAYFARQMIVNVEQNDWAEAYQNYQRAMTVWDRIRGNLSANYNKDVTDFDHVLDAINESINKRDYRMAIDNAELMQNIANRIAADFEQMYT